MGKRRIVTFIYNKDFRNNHKVLKEYLQSLYPKSSVKTFINKQNRNFFLELAVFVIIWYNVSGEVTA